MYRAVFFDLFQTLVRYNPPREDGEAAFLKELGIDINPRNLYQPFIAADEFFYEENARLPYNKRSKEEQVALYSRYQQIVLSKAGIKSDNEMIKHMIARWSQEKPDLVTFEDVIPTLKELKRCKLSLGLISNVDRDMSPTLSSLGLDKLLDTVVTSQEVGYTKPSPEIFLEALKRSETKAEETVFVGDQYRIDVLGSEAVGIRGILLDRAGFYSNINSHPRIRNLNELVTLLF